MMKPSLLTGLALAALLAGSVAASAHSVGDCTNAGVESCNAQYPNNYNARVACAHSVVTQCTGHSHGGGGGHVNKQASGNFSSSSKPAGSRIAPTIKRAR